MLELYVVAGITHLPPNNHMVSLTALKLFAGDGQYISEYFVNCPEAATAQVGDWVKPKDFRGGHHHADVERGRYMGIEVLQTSPYSAPLEVRYESDARRLGALEQFLKSQTNAHQLIRGPKQDLVIDETELRYIDSRLQEMRRHFETVRLPLEAYAATIPPKLQTRELHQALERLTRDRRHRR